MTFDFCGIGNACVDIVASVDDSFLQEWGCAKGICTYLSADTADALERALVNPRYIPGGCSANVASCIAALGGTAAFMGRVADDSIGHMFTGDLGVRNIRYAARHCPPGDTGSTRIFALITPDTQRSFAAYYGVQEHLSPADLDREAIEAARFLYLDGYALNSNAGAEAFVQAAEMARAAGKAVVLAPNDISILTKFRPAIDRLIPLSDLFFCNDAEALFLTGQPTLDRALEDLCALVPAGAVTVGQNGAWVFDRGDIRHTPASHPPGPVIDTNGAGDNFAGGCLYGLARGCSLEKAARLGNLCASAIITVYGPRPATDCRNILTLLG